MTDSVSGVTDKGSEPTPATYPVPVATAPLLNLREQAVEIKAYLADDANVFEATWLEEQQRRLQAVYSYVKDRVLRVEVSHCQRWIELRIGEWLGPAREGFKGNQYSGSLPGKEAEINDRHKHEFRFLAENKAVFLAILEKYAGEVISRSTLIAEIREALLREQSPHEWSEEELARQQHVKDGITVVANLRGSRERYLVSGLSLP